jgi:hypothetical protein
MGKTNKKIKICEKRTKKGGNRTKTNKRKRKKTRFCSFFPTIFLHIDNIDHIEKTDKI